MKVESIEEFSNRVTEKFWENLNKSTPMYHLSTLIASELRVGEWKPKSEKMEKALLELLGIQGEIHPGWNNEYCPMQWVREIAAAGLGKTKTEVGS